MSALFYIWTFPNTLIGLVFGMLGLASGGSVRLERGCFEFYGGFVTWALKRMAGNGVLAMTLGHSIVGQDSQSLIVARDHEHVHVRQYERWGPFFIPAYLTCSGYLWFKKKDCYRDNPFEVEAYSIADPHRESDAPTDR